MNDQNQNQNQIQQPQQFQQPQQQQPQSVIEAQQAQVQRDIAAAQVIQQPLVKENTPLVSGEQALQQATTMIPQSKIDDPRVKYPGIAGSHEGGVTIMVFGALGTWKTTWAGMWPKPLVLSAGQEGGDRALAMLPSLYGIAMPPVIPIDSVQTMREVIDSICSNYKRWDINTVVVDSLTYYFDLWVFDLLRHRYPTIKMDQLEKMGWAATLQQRDWGLAATHMNDLAVRLHKLGLNIIWTCLEKENIVNDVGGNRRVVSVQPYIKGESALKIPGMCQMIINAKKVFKPNPNNPTVMHVQPVFYTAPTSETRDWVRHKYGNAFPEGILIDPEYGDIPTFRSIYNRIGNFVYMT
jgi:hypothetical protein